MAKKEHERSALLENLARDTYELALEVACDKGSLHLRERDLTTSNSSLLFAPKVERQP